MALPQDIVQKQLDAYNARNLEAFLDCYSAGCVIANGLVDGGVVASGKDEIRAFYTKQFEINPDLHASLKSRSVSGQVVVDHKRVTGYTNGTVAEAITMYTCDEKSILSVAALKIMVG